MTLYQVIHDFFQAYVFSPADLPAASWEVGGVTLTLADWLNHTASIVTITALVLVAFWFVKWLVKLFANAFGWVGR